MARSSGVDRSRPPVDDSLDRLAGAGAGLAHRPRGLDAQLQGREVTVDDPSNCLTTVLPSVSGITVNDPATSRSADEVPTRTSIAPGSTTYSRSRL